jgi:hypothetical protein
MKKFITPLALFLLPLVLIFLPGFLILLHAGELYSLTGVAELSQQPTTLLFSPAYSNYRALEQQVSTKLRHPTVLALGNSRVGEFRAAFFKEPDTFYNATGAVGALSDFTNFLRSLEPYHPQILIINMDHYFFNPDQAKNNVVIRPNPFTTYPVRITDVALESLVRNGGWWKVFQDYRQGKFTFGDIFRVQNPNIRNIGLRAIVESSGATNDGSDYYGKVISTPAVQEQILRSIDDLAQSISDTNGDWYGVSVSPQALSELHDFLLYAKKQNIYVIGFLAPIAPKEFTQIKAHPHATYANTLAQLSPTLTAAFQEQGFNFFDFSDSSTLGSTDHEMVDSKHGSEKLYLRMMIEMAKHDEKLQPLTNIPYLTNKLSQATSTYVVFGLTK